jgi:pyruvate/2-oxoglutarate dehydrogenase complex dihydrolipoamide dehydrogenase (E3) component
MSTEEFDGIVIGAGQGGKPLAVSLAQAGWKMALVERRFIGGTCINVGCTPTKTMVASARVAYLAHRASAYGVNVGSVAVDMQRVRERTQGIVRQFRASGERLIETTQGLSLLSGEGSFTGPTSVRVRLATGQTVEIEGKKIFVNTGGRPAIPEIPGLVETGYLDSSSILDLDAIPGHLVVLGGGYIGIEFGQMFRRFGSDVTIVHRGKHLLSREDPDVADEVAGILRDEGVQVLLESRVDHVGSREQGRKLVAVQTPGGERSLEGTHVLVAVGRRPNTEELNLSAAGVEVDGKGFIRVDEHLETTVSDVYALGDVKGGPAFTHISYDDYRVLFAHLTDGANRSTRDRLVPYAVFIDPQLGRIGLSETEARASGYDVRVAKIPMTWVARALEMDESRGFMKAVVDAKTERILGAAVLGVEGGELMAVLQASMMGNLPFTALREAVFAHPTLAESLNTIFASLDL